MCAISRRSFFQNSVLAAATVGGTRVLSANDSSSFGENRPLMEPVFEAIVCPWTPKHPRHDHQLIFSLDDERLMLVWSEYYSTKENPQIKRGQAGATDAVSCQISSMISNGFGVLCFNRSNVSRLFYHRAVGSGIDGLISLVL